LPLDPRNSVDWAVGIFVNDDFDAILTIAKQAMTGSSDDVAHEDKKAHQEANRLHEALRDWRPKYEKAIEYAAAKIYCALREGVLTSKGVLLPDPDPAIALTKLADQGKGLDDLEDLAIPSGLPEG
jgi:hypothetical protein